MLCVVVRLGFTVIAKNVVERIVDTRLYYDRELALHLTSVRGVNSGPCWSQSIRCILMERREAGVRFCGYGINRFLH